MRVEAMARRGLVILMILCLTTGCWDRREMDDLALVVATGIDLTDDGQIEMTYQVALPTGIPSAVKTGGGAQKPVVVISNKGRDIQEANDRLQEQMSRFIYFGHREVFIIGEKCARHGLNQIQDLLTRFPENRYNCFVLTAYGATAKEILNVPYQLELIPGLGISKLQSSRSSFSVKSDELFEAFSSPGISPVTAAIRVLNKDTDKESFAVDHAAVYLGDQLTGFLKPDELELLRWWIDDPYRIGFTVQAQPEDKQYKGTISVKSLKSSVKVKTVIKNELPQVTASFSTLVRVVTNNSRIDLNNPQDRILVEKLFSKQVQGRIESMLGYVQKKLKSDIFGIGEEVHIEHPYIWKKIMNKWSDIFPDVPVTVKVDLTIEQIGKTLGRSHIRK
ncbi:Ger(x)C family spore germination protein [Paenibacillus sp. HW567]|uniref:Ger(x)C family spore germination protein n=1 Tax=Paenibacillus sp. HW567 TaxID=1034769 RepID=UPI0003A4866C|nr:Ger(x)C family spore germination protein [Paenibacillus sp. HW567]